MITPNTSLNINGYQVTAELYRDTKTVVYRAQPEKFTPTQEPRSVVIKLLAPDYPTDQELLNFRHQYTITKNLDSPYILRADSLQEYGHSYALVMEDFGGISLLQYHNQQPLSLAEILAIGQQLATALHFLGLQRIIHKDIKPANILIHPVTKQTKLIDFSIASLLPRETSEILSPNLLEGTLAYLSPEQTGRMNRGIDYRTDFYALGVTLYELLTGQLPFDATEPLALLHCHLTQSATPVAQINPAVPRAVSNIVGKLMSKNAEDRYQSALGLRYDLDCCLQQWQTSGTISEFQIGQRDLSDRFVIPEKLYGREIAVKTLLAAFDRVTAGSSELMLVAGWSGIGKTVVINEVHKPITRQQGYFIKGKFDQFNRNIPLSAFVQAFRDLVGQLLSENDAQLASWKNQILDVVAENGQVLIAVIPELAYIIGSQPAVPELFGTAAQNRFNELFQKFIAVFTQPQHPLTIFLDDLQWADFASLQLVKILMGSTGHLLMLGAYRDNEVSPLHPAMLMVEELQQAHRIVQTITLLPLSFEDTNQLVSDTLHCSATSAKPLTGLILLKTQGNPFFSTQFLRALASDGQLKFNPHEGHWECDIGEVQALSIPDNVVEFMATQLQKLPATTQNVLRLAACIGDRFDLDTLAIVSEQSQLDTATALWKGLQAGLITPTSQIYKFWQADSQQQLEQAESVELIYRFLHDRVQQAAYSLIPEHQKQQTHWQIGRLLLANTPHITERLFEIVNHLNTSIALIGNPAERYQLAQLNLDAARKARASTSYAAAFSYAQVGTQLLATAGWEQQYMLTLALHEILAETAFLKGDFGAVPELVQVVLERVTTTADLVTTYETIIHWHVIQKQYREAIERGIEILQRLGIKLAPRPPKSILVQELLRTKIALWGKSPTYLLNLPEITDPAKIAPLRILDLLMIPAFLSCRELTVTLGTTGIQLTLQHGNSPWAASFYGIYCMAISTRGELQQSYNMGQLALKLVDRFDHIFITSKVTATIPWFSQLWRQNLRSILPIIDHSIKLSTACGNFTFLGLGSYIALLTRLSAGFPLSNILEKIAELGQCVEQSKDESSIELFALQRQMIINLQTPTSHPYRLIRDDQDEKTLVAQWQQNGEKTLLSTMFTCQNWLAYLLEDFSSALIYAEAYQPYETAKTGMSRIDLFAILTRLAVYPQSDRPQQKRLLRKVHIDLRELQKRARLMPDNFQHKYDLVVAEKCRVLGNFVRAMELFDSAIAGAKAHQYLHEEALANELAAKLYLDWGKEKIAATYLLEAYYCYVRWGATVKTNNLLKRYPQLLLPMLQQTQSLQSIPLSTLATVSLPRYPIVNNQDSGSYAFDTAAIIQAAQSLSSMIELPALIQELCRILLQNSGAQICIPILRDASKINHQDLWQVYQLAPTNLSNTVGELTCSPLNTYQDLPLKLINQVCHGQQTIILNSDYSDPALLADPYLQRHQPQSMMCLPLLYRGELQGLMYLENRDTAGVFTPDRQIILEFLAAQAVITLHNAQLYESVAQRSAAMEASLDGMAIIEPPGYFTYVNRSYAQMHGYEIDDLVGQDWRYLIAPNLRANFESEVCTELTTTGKWRGEMVTTRRDNSTFDREVTLFLLPQGQIISICRDITERQMVLRHSQRVAAELAISQQKYYSLIQSINGVVWEYDLQAERFTFVSDRVESLFGYDPTDWLSQSNFWHSILYPEDATTTVQSFDEAIANRRSCELEYRLVAADGRAIWVYDVSTLVCDAVGQPLTYSGVFINIDDLKRVEIELYHANERLELTNAELHRATRLKDQFLATMSHELRTPMNAILGMSEILQEEILGPLNARQLKSLATIEHSGQHLLTLINEILDVSKISAGKLELSRSDVSLTELCESSLLFVKQLAFEKQIQITTDWPADATHIWVDSRRMRQVLINLLTNAVKFTGRGGHIALRATIQSASIPASSGAPFEQTICLDVSDTGIGIKPTDINKLFQPFIQIDSDLNRQYEGTGLGLVLVKQIVELHGGYITIDSTVGAGSCFGVVIPHRHHQNNPELSSERPAELPPTANRQSPAPVLTSTKPLSTVTPLILLVEDHEINIETFSNYLTFKGYRLLVAQSGQEAIELAQQEQPDLILMDIQMPGMDGITTIQYLRQLSTWPQRPIIALTALAMAGDREKCLAAGANSYLTKPVRLEELHQTIQQQLQVIKNQS